MKVLWICGLPEAIEQKMPGQEKQIAQAAWSWIVAHLPPPDGVELHLGCLWPGGEKRKTVEYEGVQVHLLPCPRRGRALLLFQQDAAYFQALFDELKPEIVHGWGTEDSYGLVARKLAPYSHVIGIQGLIRAYRKHLPKHFRTVLVSITEWLTLRKARNVVAESQYSLHSAAPLCRDGATRRVIEHPLRPEFLRSAPSDGTHQTALFVGRIQERKGISEAIRAFAKVAPAEWNLHVVGQGTSKSEKRMHELVTSSGIASRFHHSPTLGAQDLVKTMQESSIFLLPTHIDTGPTVLKEALTMGLWPVCYDNSGPGEYVRKYDFGSLAKDRDLNSLCVELRDCMLGMPWKDGKKRLALAGKTRIDFSGDQAWNQLGEFYGIVLSQRSDKRF
jgi:glycosyltransferase involved in cell wall biosynthesis